MAKHVNYDDVAPSYHRRYERQEYPGTAQALNDVLAARPTSRALDVGCGTGHWLAEMRGRVARLAGIDASASMLEQARAKLPDAELVLGRAEQLPWNAAAFDLVWCNNALHHFADPSAFVREAFRVLAPGGLLLVIVLQPSAVTRWAIYDYFEGTRERDEQRYPSAAQIQRWMEQAGFRRCETRPVERIQMSYPARDAIERGLLDRHVTSQLSLLSEADYARGMARVRAAASDAESRGETLSLHSDLWLYGSYGERSQ